MQGSIRRTTAVFSGPFRLPGLDEVLPAGEYELQTEIDMPVEHPDPDRWRASVMVRLHRRRSHPGLDRTMTVPLVALEQALARDLTTGHGSVDAFIEDLLSDPIVRLIMKADGVSEAEVRQLEAYSGRTDVVGAGRGSMASKRAPLWDSQDAAAVQRAENEGMRPSLIQGPAKGAARDRTK